MGLKPQPSSIDQSSASGEPTVPSMPGRPSIDATCNNVPMPPAQFSSPVPPMVSLYAPLRKPPKFDVGKFAPYKEELDLWKDSHPHVDISTLVAEIALQSEIPLRTIMLKFTKETNDRKEERVFARLIPVPNKEFQRDSNGRSVLKCRSSNN